MQKRVLKLIYGYDKTYQQLLEEAGLTSLEERRQKNLLKFAQKTLKNSKYSDRWFPKRELQRVNRHTAPYLEEKASGDRLYKSPIFTMRRLLNGNFDQADLDLTGLFNNPWATL